MNPEQRIAELESQVTILENKLAALAWVVGHKLLLGHADPTADPLAAVDAYFARRRSAISQDPQSGPPPSPQQDRPNTQGH